MNQFFIKHSRPFIDNTEIDACTRLLLTESIASGKLVQDFEQELSSYLGYEFGIATSSGTSALILILKMLGIKSGDEVIVPIYCCSSVAKACLAVGATPVYCDSSEFWCSSFQDIEKVLSKKTKAIVLVHLFGIDASLPQLDTLGIPIIEDLSHAIGLRRRHISIFGLAFTSLHATKCLTTGEGGMALFSRPGSLDFYGDFSLTSVESIESRMSNHSAALGIAQLSKYHEMLARRHFIAEEYLRALDDSQLDIFEMKKLFKGNSTGQRSSIFFRFVARVDCDIQHTIEFFEKSHQIALRRGVDSLSEMDESKFPGAFRNFRTTISIPLYPALEDYEVHRLITSIKGFFHA